MTVLQALKTSFYFKNGVLLWEVPCQQKHSIAQGRQLHPHPDVGGKAQICPFANHWSQLTTRHYLYLNTFTVYIHAVISWDTPVKSDGTWSHGLELRDWNFHPILYRCIQVKDLPIGASQNSRFPPPKPSSCEKKHMEVLKFWGQDPMSSLVRSPLTRPRWGLAAVEYRNQAKGY